MFSYKDDGLFYIVLSDLTLSMLRLVGFRKTLLAMVNSGSKVGG